VRRPDVVRFFRTTWIPDETFFQTLVAHLVPRTEIVRQTPTFLMFSDYGMPVTFYNDHYDLLLGRRRSSPARSRPRRGSCARGSGALRRHRRGLPHLERGRRLHAFLTARGRTGQRFAPRFWEEGGLARPRPRADDRHLQEMARGAAARGFAELRSNLPAVEYIFDEEGAALPDLGGIETRSPSARATAAR
jgi:hypothetical protein